jgi:hypothetical protein
MAQIRSKNSRFKWILILCFLALLPPSVAFAGTYYIASIGSDTNDGTTQTTPWLHAPGMNGCSSNCASYTPSAGDSFIFRGGDTWTLPSMGSWAWGYGKSWNGTSTSPIYIGVDQTWYSGTFWARPILSAGGQIVGYGVLGLFANYITIDNFEFTGGSWTAGNTNEDTYINTNSSTNFTIQNCYFHGWSVPSNVDDGQEIALGGGTGGIIQNCVIDGFDTAAVEADPNCTGACLGSTCAISGYGAPTIQNNTIRHVASGFIGNVSSFHNNVLEYLRYSVNSANHQDAFMSVADPMTGSFVYNNLIAHTPQSVSLWISPQRGASSPSYVFNNVIHDGTASANILAIADPSTNPGGTVYIYNNTIQGGPQASANEPCVSSETTDTTIIAVNNYCISNDTVFAVQTGTLTQTTNLLQTQAVAIAQGYTSANNYAPVSASGSTVGAGTNLTTVGIAALDSDIVATPRPSSVNWDIGAYEYATGGLAPPTGVYLLPPNQ